MRVLLLNLLLVVGAASARAQVVPATGATPAAFVPAGYRVLPEGRATGDLNGDGRPDVALALGAVAEDTKASDELPPRLLLVLWRTAAGGYTLAGTARQALLGKGDSYLGDPYAGITIERGILLMHYDVGGSRGRTTTVRFRYQQHNFYLIGETDAFGTHRPDCEALNYPPGYQYRDTNFVTGSYECIRVSEECRLLAHKRGRQPVKPLVRLTAYKPAS